MNGKSKTNRKKLRIFSIALSMVLFCGLFSGCYLLPEEEQKLEAPTLKVKEITYTKYTVEKGDIDRWENGTGHFASTKNETLSFGKSGTLKKIYVRSGDTVGEGQLLAELDTDGIADQIEYQEYVVERARLNYLAQTGTGYQIAKLDYDYQKKQLDKLYVQAENSAIYAPMDGIITYAAGINSGDRVEGDRGIITMADPTQLIILYKATAVDEIYTGMQIDIHMRNDDKIHTGVVVQTPGDVPADASNDDRTYIFIELEEIPSFASVGTSVNIEILLAKRENVIALPSKYISKVSTRYYVRVLVDGLPEERDVTVGINNGSLYEITGGIEVGEELVA